MKTYLFHGPSGSGKDTQINKLSEKIKFERIGSGDMFRTLYEKGEADGIEAHKYWSVGKWVPDDLTYSMLSKWLEKFDNTKDWVFVSVVRTIDQIALFDNLLRKYNRKLDYFVHFSLSDEAAVERMSLRTVCPICKTNYHKIYKKEKVEGICDIDGGKLFQREDDKPEKIIMRLSEYRKDIADILKEYEKRKILIDIDASRSIDVIFEELCIKLGV